MMLRTELIRPVVTLLSAHAQQRGEQVAYCDPHRSLSYGELAVRTARLAGHLQTHGLQRGARAMIYMDNCVEVAESYLAITRAGGVGVCANPQATAREVGYMLEDSAAGVLVTDPEHLDTARELAAQATSVESLLVTGAGTMPGPGAGMWSYEQAATIDADEPPRDDLDLDDPAWMLYTSGTTGRPKGVLLTQRSCLWVVSACWAPIAGLSTSDYVLSPLPLFHSYALNLSVLGVLAVGATEYLMPRFSPSAVHTLLHTEPITFLCGVPTMFLYLLDAVGEHSPCAPHLRMCVSAGAIMPATLNRTFEHVFQAPLLDGYGITETSTMVTMNWPTGTRIMGSCGLPLPGSAVRIRDPTTSHDVPPGHEGELWVRGPHVMLGYHNRPEETEQVLQDGWYRTGDLGHQDEHGYLTITGRIKELIIRGGENIYPAEVEEALLVHPNVLDAAVSSRADEELGEVPIAFVVAHDLDTFDSTAVLDSCRNRLAEYKIPPAVHLVSAIPRTGSGKIRRHELPLPNDPERAAASGTPPGGASDAG